MTSSDNSTNDPLARTPSEEDLLIATAATNFQKELPTSLFSWRTQFFSGVDEDCVARIKNDGEDLLRYLRRGAEILIKRGDSTWCRLSDEPTPSVVEVIVRNDANLSVSKTLFASAVSELKFRYDCYCWLLGDLIPADVLAAADHELTWEEYCTESLPTAADDWPHFLRSRKTIRGAHSPVPGLQTGLPQLDASLGGLRGLTLIGANTGVGKTTLALQTTHESLASDPKLAALVLSLEMPRHMIYERLARRFSTSINSGTVSHELEEDQPTTEQKELLSRLKVISGIRFCRGERRPVRSFISTTASRLLRQTGADRFLIVLDFFQLLPVRKSGSDNLEQDHRRLETLRAVQEGIHRTLGDESCSMILISELRKTDYQQSRPRVDDLLGSARLGYLADTILLMRPDEHPTGASEGESDIVLDVAKGRDNVERGEHPLTFHYLSYRFSYRSRHKSAAKDSSDAPAVDVLDAGRPRRVK